MKGKRLAKSHLTPREKGAATGFVTLGLLFIFTGVGYAILRPSFFPAFLAVMGAILIFAVMLEIGRREESRSGPP